jgi:fatty acid desaturase
MHFILSSMRRPRHPLARALSLLLGVALISVLLVFGLVVVSVLLVGGGLLLAWRQWTRARHPAAPTTQRAAHQPQTLEGEYVVIHSGRPTAH